MPKFNVMVEDVINYIFNEIEAKDEEEAIDKCWDLLENEEVRTKHFNGKSEGKSFVFKID